MASPRKTSPSQRSSEKDEGFLLDYKTGGGWVVCGTSVAEWPGCYWARQHRSSCVRLSVSPTPAWETVSTGGVWALSYHHITTYSANFTLQLDLVRTLQLSQTLMSLDHDVQFLTYIILSSITFLELHSINLCWTLWECCEYKQGAVDIRRTVSHK